MSSLVASQRIENQERFRLRILQEWRRAERSGRPALLVLFDGLENPPGSREAFLQRVTNVFRDTDVLGWYTTDQTLGVICLELGKSDIPAARQVIVNKAEAYVMSTSGPKVRHINVTVHVLPPYTGEGALHGPDAELAATLCRNMPRDPWAVEVIKRALDIAGSAFLLLLMLPILLTIAAAIRLTSRGPALFRQIRTGLGGRTFHLFKFRTMLVDTNDRLHLDYVKQFINGNAEKHLDDHGQPIYKLTRDPRVTPLGRFLRRTSLDELPQLWNVLRGDMTLVGPRPPLPYEVECYDLWHRRRVFELKPGLTGLWQVRGRSRCSFDEMIRLDLQHGKPNSLALYLRVLLETPRAVISGGGAQ
jgi:lipopolysaccharide/colanic/teichoic acid biosynthesis glycosyltransferase